MGCQNSKELANKPAAASSTDADKKKMPVCAQKTPFKVNLE